MCGVALKTFLLARITAACSVELFRWWLRLIRIGLAHAVYLNEDAVSELLHASMTPSNAYAAEAGRADRGWRCIVGAGEGAVLQATRWLGDDEAVAG